MRRVAARFRNIKAARRHTRGLASAASHNECDVCVVGGGLVGAFTALSLAKKGVKVTILEQHADVCHEQGSSHGDGRIFRFAYPIPEYIELARKSTSGWKDLQEKSGKDLLLGVGGLDIGHRDGNRIQGLIKTLDDLQIDYELLEQGQLEKRFPQFSLREQEIAVYQSDARCARATPIIGAVWNQLKHNNFTEVTAVSGSRLHSIEGVSNTNGPLTLNLDASDPDNGEGVGTGRGSNLKSVTAGKVVLAMGAWVMPFMSKIGLRIPLIGTEECCAYFMPKKGKRIDHTFKTMPVFIPHFDHEIVTELKLAGIDHESANDWGFYGLPQVEIPGVKISAHHTGRSFLDPGDRPSRSDPMASEERKKEIIASCQRLISHLFPHLDPKPAHTIHCLYTSTPDHDFLIDTHPNDNRIVLATGFSGHGFKFGPALGDLITGLVMDGRSSRENASTRRFALERFENSGVIGSIDDS